MNEHRLLVVDSVVKVNLSRSFCELVVFCCVLCFVCTTRLALEDAFLEEGTLSIVLSSACGLPILAFVKRGVHYTGRVHSLLCVVIRNDPVSAVSVCIDRSIKVDRAAQVVPLVLISIVEAQHVVDLCSRSADLNARLQRHKQGTGSELILCYLVSEVHGVLVCVVGLRGSDDSDCVLRRLTVVEVIDIARIREVRCSAS